MLATVVVVTYHSASGAPREIAQLAELAGRRRDDVRWVFVDNSPDGADADALERVLPPGSATVLRLPHNPGFAGGCNAGAAVATGRWLVLLNPDLSVPEPLLEQLLEVLRRAAPGGCVAFSQRTRGRLHCGIGLTWFQWFIDRPAGRGGRLLGPSGGAAAYDLATFVACGGFDPALESWGEDVDLAFRLARAGVPTVEADLGIPHLGGHSVSTPEVRDRRAYLLVRNRIVVARRHYSRPRLAVALATWPVVLGVLAVRHARAGSGAPFMRGIRDGLLGGMLDAAREQGEATWTPSSSTR
jgi:N-acetylglucosaminyl-diphospho-decaprenol L-rhamnosyltransferase